MMMKILRIVLAICFLVGMGAQHTMAAEWILNEVTGNEYKFLDMCGTWQACEDLAVIQDAHLVTINDQDEQDWISDTFGCSGQECVEYAEEKSNQFWLGMRCDGPDCPECNGNPPPGGAANWFWSSGEPVTYTNWMDNCTPFYAAGPYVVNRQIWPFLGDWDWDQREIDNENDGIAERIPQEEDWRAASTIDGPRSVSGSTGLNYLAILLVPAAAIAIMWKRRSRK